MRGIGLRLDHDRPPIVDALLDALVAIVGLMTMTYYGVRSQSSASATR
jgi:hypothetical protein